MKLKLIFGFFAVLILSACGLSEQDDTAPINTAVPETKNAQPTSTLSNTPEPTATETITPIPTATLSPTSTFTPLPTNTTKASETPSPTPIPIAIVDVQLANIYSGVATYAPVVAIFAKDTALKILGITSDDNWLLVEIAPEQNGWVQKKAVHLKYQFSIPMIDPPPPPTLTPTAAKIPSISVQAGKDLFIMEFFNFQPNEQLRMIIYKNDKFVTRLVNNTGSAGYGRRDISHWLKLTLGANYRIVVNGAHGSYAEKTFTP